MKGLLCHAVLVGSVALWVIALTWCEWQNRYHNSANFRPDFSTFLLNGMRSTYSR